jgi:hypothetical protein
MVQVWLRTSPARSPCINRLFKVSWNGLGVSSVQRLQMRSAAYLRLLEGTIRGNRGGRHGGPSHSSRPDRLCIPYIHGPMMLLVQCCNHPNSFVWSGVCMALTEASRGYLSPIRPPTATSTDEVAKEPDLGTTRTSSTALQAVVDGIIPTAQLPPL